MATDIPNLLAVVGIAAASNSGILYYDTGAVESVVALVTATVVANLYFPFPMSVVAQNSAGTNTNLRCKGDNIASDYTIIYIEKP